VGSFTFEHLIDTGIIRSHTYNFFYKAVNQHGVGSQSSTSTIEASTRPAQLAAPNTINEGVQLKIMWNETPDNHGNAVTSYTILIRQTDGVFSESSECLGTQSTILSQRYCHVQMSTLREAPYSLELGDLIEVTVQATNDKGTSDPSNVNIVGAVV
jgi:hypothetical protein